MSKDEIKVIMDKFSMPSNIEDVVTPRVSVVIWPKFSHQTKQNDTHLTHIGDRVTQGLIGNVMLADKLNRLREKVANQEDITEIRAMTKMAFIQPKLMQGQFRPLAIRKLKMRVYLSFNFKIFCNPPENEGTDLFGSNVTERIKEINKLGSLGNQIAEGKGFKGGFSFNKSKYCSKQTKCDSIVVNDCKKSNRPSASSTHEPKRGQDGTQQIHSGPSFGRVNERVTIESCQVSIRKCVLLN